MNKERLWLRLRELSKIGKQENGGITRFSFTEEEREAKKLVAQYMKEAGLLVRQDEAGNLIGRFEGTNPNAPAVVIGSHLDSVPNGGAFDGPLGVLAGIETVQTLNEQNINTTHPIEVIAFTDEEGSRFGLGMIGSRAFAGTLQAEQLTQEDRHGITIAEAMAAAGLEPSLVTQAARAQAEIKAYIELHIEQGKVLEQANSPAGIVTGIAGPLWTRWTITGEAGHAGATPMNQRKDSLVAAAQIIQYINKKTQTYEHAVATIGQISVEPGGINVIPEKTTFTLDLRHINEEIRNELEQNITSFSQKLCEENTLSLEIETLQRVLPAPCSKEIQSIIESSFTGLSLTPYFLPSGAGHDGMQFHSLCPIGMIFVRSKNGLSHHPDEWSSKEDCGVGATILYDTVYRLAK